MAGTINVGTVKVGGLKELKAELASIKDQLATMTPNTDEWTALQDKAGDIKKKIKSINSGINEMSKGSNIDQTKKSFQEMQESLMNLDFAGAAKQSAIFQQSLTTLSRADIIKPFQNLATVIGNLSKSFIQFGIMLLTNPLFLLATVIVAIVAGIGALLDAFGLLQPILDAVGVAFDFIVKVVNVVIDAIKEFLSWFGLSEGAADKAENKAQERHKAELKRQQELKAAKELNFNNEQTSLQRQIDLYKAQGKETYLLEMQKLQASVNYQKTLYDELIAEQRLYDQVLAKLELQGLMNTKVAEEALKRRDELKKGANDAKNAVLDAVNQAQILTINYENSQKEQVKTSKESNAKLIEQRKEALEKIAALEDKFRYNQLDARKKELEDIDNNYKEAFQLAKKYGQDTSTLLSNYNAERKAVNDKYDEEERLKLKEQADALALLQRELGYKVLTETEASRQKERDALNDWYKEKLELYKDDATTTAQLQEQQRIDELDLQDKYAKEDAEKVKAYSDTINTIKYELSQVGLSDEEIARQNERKALEDWYTEKMELAKLDAAVQEEIQVAYQKKKMELLQSERDAEIQLAIDKGNTIADVTKDGLSTVNDVIQAFAGESEKQQEKAFKINKAANIAMSVIDTLKGAVAAYTSQIVATDPTSVIRGAIAAAMVTAAGIANIKKIASTQFKGASASGASGSAGASGGGGGVQPATPQTNLFGQSNNMNTLQGAQSVEKPQVVRAVVVESDITSSQSRVRRMEENATL